MKSVRAGLTILLLALASAPLHSETRFKILKKIPAIGDSGWDYLTFDESTRKLYVSHGTRVNVIDADRLETVRTLYDTPGAHTVVLVHSLKRGFISQGKTDSVLVFDMKSTKKIAEIPAQKNPDTLVFDSVTQRIFAFNHNSNSVTIIDPKEMDVIDTVSLGGRPEFAVADGSGHIYVDIQDRNSVAQFETRNPKNQKTWALTACEEPTSIAMDVTRRRLFIGCRNRTLIVTDADSGRSVATVPIGAQNDGAVFDSEKGLVYASNGDGTLTVIKAEPQDRYSVVENVPTPRGARTIALDPRTHHVFVATAEFGPASTGGHQSILPGTFAVFVIGQ